MNSLTQDAEIKIHLSRVLKKTLTSLLYPQVVLLFFLPFLISTLFVISFVWLTWEFWYRLFIDGLLVIDPYWKNFLNSVPEFLVQFFEMLRPVVPVLFFVLVFALAFPLIIVLNLIVTSFFASTYLVHFIARRDYPDMVKQGRSRVVEGLFNAIKYGLLYLLVWGLTFPLWLIPGAQLALPILLTAWLNRQVCTFDALTDYASDQEFEFIREKTRTQGYILGLITSGLNYIPFALFISPVITMVAYIYFGFEALKVGRSGSFHDSRA